MAASQPKLRAWVKISTEFGRSGLPLEEFVLSQEMSAIQGAVVIVVAFASS